MIKLTATSMYHTDQHSIWVNPERIESMSYDSDFAYTDVKLTGGKHYTVAERPAWIAKLMSGELDD